MVSREQCCLLSLRQSLLITKTLTKIRGDAIHTWGWRVNDESFVMILEHFIMFIYSIYFLTSFFLLYQHKILMLRGIITYTTELSSYILKFNFNSIDKFNYGNISFRAFFKVIYILDSASRSDDVYTRTSKLIKSFKTIRLLVYVIFSQFK